MSRRLEVWLNDASLRDADARILIANIRDDAPEIETSFGAYAGRDGQRLISRRRVAREIAVEFRVREIMDMSARQRALDAVGAWAQAGYLRTNVRDDKRIWVEPIGWPGMTTPRDYTELFTVTFSGAPYWEDFAPTTCNVASSASGTGTLANLGSESSPCDVEISVTSGALSTLAVTVGDTSIALSGLNVAAGGSVIISHSPFGTLAITAAGVSALDKRTPASADDLLAAPGANAVTITANTPVSASISTRGRWR